MRQLVKEISNAIKLASKKNMKPCFRLNLTSDIAWESQNSMVLKLWTFLMFSFMIIQNQ